MKYLLPLLCLLSGTTAFAQSEDKTVYPPPRDPVVIRSPGQESKEAFKGANVIVLHTTDSSAVALKKFARLLISNGITPDQIQTEIGFITTKGLAVGNLTPATFEYKAVSQSTPAGTVLRITGHWTVRYGLASSMTNSMYWTKGNGNQGKLCFSTIEKVALLYPLARLAYATQEEKVVLH